MRLLLFTDGASKGNPGPAGAGVVLKDQKGNILAEEFQFLGRMTNNEAEYRALLLGLSTVKEYVKGPDADLVCLIDSELVVSQLRGLYRVKAAHLRELLTKVKIEEGAFSKIVYRFIPREDNAHADKLANKALKGR